MNQCQGQASTGARVAVISQDGLAWHDCAAGARPPTPGTVLVPSEHVLLKSVAFPNTSRQQRLAAAPFALEEDLATPLDATHICIGPPVSPGRYLLGAVQHQVMAHWVASAKGAGLRSCRLVPDCLMLPPPPEGAWTVAVDAERAVVRTSDAGFATAQDLLPLAWRLSDCPPIMISRGHLPSAMADADILPNAGGPPLDPLGARFDLCQGRYALQRNAWPRALAQIAALIMLGACLETGLLAFEVHRLSGLEATQRGEAASLLNRLAPSTGPAPDPADALLRLLPRAEIRQDPRFLDQFARVAGALGANADGLALSKVDFKATDGTLAMTVSAGDLAALRQIEGALGAAGLAPQSGTANVTDGGAEVRIVLTGAGARP